MMIDQADRPNRLSGAVAFHWFGDAPPLALSIPEQIATSVGERIVSGCYPPSARITEQDLANEFHVSRGPIRDALRMLERERLVRILPRHGAKVAHLTSNDLHEVLEVSTALQRIGAVKLAETQPPAALQMLRQGVASLESLACDSQGAARFVEIAFELNIRSAHLSGNPRRAELLGSLLLQIMPYWRLSLQPVDARLQALQHWNDLVDAICRGDTQEAGDLIERTNKHLHELVTYNLEESIGATSHALDREGPRSPGMKAA